MINDGNDPKNESTTEVGDSHSHHDAGDVADVKLEPENDESLSSKDEVVKDYEVRNTPYADSNKPTITDGHGDSPMSDFAQTTYGVPVEELFMGTSTDQVVTEWMFGYTAKGLFSQSSRDEHHNWVPNIKEPEKPIIGPTKPRLRSTGGNLKGSSALELIRKRTQTGGMITFPLVHSGIVATMRPAKESEIIDFEHRISSTATRVGINTSGQLLHARSAVFVKELCELAFDLIVSTNLKVSDPDILRETISSFDYSTLCWAALSTKYPDGFPWNIACSFEECKEVTPVTMHFPTMYRMDRNAITPTMRTILTKSTVTVEDLELYQKELKCEKAKIDVGDGIKLILKSSTIGEWIDDGLKWVSEIETAYNSAMSTYTSEDRRHRYMNSLTQAKRLLKYRHLIDKIEIIVDEETGASEIIDDPDNIDEIIEEISGLTSHFILAENGILSFIQENALTLIGYPTHACPSCGKVHETKDGPFRAIVPIAVDRLLFTLVQQRVSLMVEMSEE